jgi:hypothetical protein
MSLADIVSRHYTWEELQQGCENAYRRGVHHGTILSSGLAADVHADAETMRLLRRAERLAGRYRDHRRYPGQPPIVQEIRGKLARSAEKRRRA